MANLKIHGLTELMKEIQAISELDNGELAKKMLKAGSEEVEKKWREKSETMHGRHTGRMKAAVKSTRIKKNKYGRFVITYPMEPEYEIRIRRGKEVKVRHAEKAFYQHYGWTNNLTGRFVAGDRWVDIIDIQAEPIVNKKMQSIFDEWLKKQQK